MGERWYPPGTKRGVEVPSNDTIILLGEYGDGKTHSGRQLCFDPWLQSEGILLLVSDGNALGTIGKDALAREGIHVQEVGTFDEVREVARQLGAARTKGELIPETVFYDGLYGGSHKTRQFYQTNPILSPERDEKGRATGEMRRDSFKEFSAKGYGGIDAIIGLRDHAKPRTLVITATIHSNKSGEPAELSVEGQILPKNLGALSTVTFGLKRKRVEFDPLVDKATAELAAEGLPWLKFDRASNGQLTGVCMKRVFVTEGGGEIKTKPHRILNFEENMDLPNIIRRLHEKETLSWWKEAPNGNSA